MQTETTGDGRTHEFIEAGDILDGTWGYNMVLPLWYKVVSRTNKTVMIQELEEKVISGGYNGYWESMPSDKPRVRSFEPTLLKRKISTSTSYDGKRTMEYVRVNKYQTVYLWDGRPNSCTDMD